jgi:hypothetical protein
MIIQGAVTVQTIPGIIRTVEHQLQHADIARITRAQWYSILAVLDPQPEDRTDARE